MTKQEFEKRIGASVTAEDYAEINLIYLNALGMEKDEFCYNWRTKNGRKEIMKALLKRIWRKNERIDAIATENVELKIRLTETAEFLLSNPDAEAMRNKAIELLGSEREYIRRKCERGLPLDADDKAAIHRLL